MSRIYGIVGDKNKDLYSLLRDICLERLGIYYFYIFLINDLIFQNITRIDPFRCLINNILIPRDLPI